MQTILKGRGLSFIAQTFLLSTTTTRRLFSSTSIRFKQKKYILVYKEKLLAKKLLESLKPPMGPVKTDSDLVRALFALNSKHAKSTVYTAPADPSIKLRSWKMMEHRYYDIPSPFPTLARGLFTRDLTEQDAEGKNAKGGEDTAKKYQIVVRGYDKFFNIGEVPWTEVRVLGSLISCRSDTICSGTLLRRTRSHRMFSRSSRTGASSSSRR